MTRRHQHGLTLIEVMLAMAIMALMMTLAWRTITSTANASRQFEKFEERNHELRLAMSRITSDLEHAYLSRNEDQTQSHPRTMFVAKSGKFPEIRFSTLGHRILWGDANESEQTVISYVTRDNPQFPGETDLVRSEQRRLSNEPPEEEPVELDVLCTRVDSLELEYWDWKNAEWQDTWDTTQGDGEKNTLPGRVRITLTVKDGAGEPYKLTSEARILMQEPLQFVQ